MFTRICSNNYFSRVLVPVYRLLKVLRIKPSFLPVDIQHTQCPCRFFILERYQFCGHKTTTWGGIIISSNNSRNSDPGLRPSFLSRTSNNSRNSDPGSHNRLFSLLPHYGFDFYREKTLALSSLVNSRQIVLITHAIM